MKKQGFFMRKAAFLSDWLQIYRLYRRSFPACERKPFRVILSMHRRGKTDVFLFNQEGRFAGFATTINGDRLILLDYLAVREDMRGRGVGSRALQGMMDCYSGRGMFVEIESVHEVNAPNADERLRRRNFYFKNGMQDMDVQADVFGVHMELLGMNCSMDFDRYRAFYRDHYSAWAAEHIIEHKI